MTSRDTQILLVEDNPDDALLFQRIHGPRHGVATPEHVTSLAAALARLDSGGIDVVLLDLSLPDAHGVETVRRVVEHTPDVPVVVLTGLDDEETGRNAIQAGAQDYLVKNHLDRRTLDRCLRYAVERQRLLRREKEDAHVAAILARTGERLLALNSTAGILVELCRIAREAAGADFAHTWLLNEDASRLLPRASDPPADWAELHAHTLSRAWTADAEPPPCELYPAPDDLMRIPLCRGETIVGIVVCGARRWSFADAATWYRVREGLKTLGSLALENTRLLEELEDSSRAKTYFAATMSHELRNTLGVIIGFTDLLLRCDPAANREQYQQHLKTLRARARESLQIIQATLELTRSEAVSTPTWANTDVLELAREIVRDTVLPPEKCDLTIRVLHDADVPHVQTDPTKLQMIVRNLLTNAVKFSERGEITITLRCGGRGIELQVRDPGRGIPEALLPTLFEPFRQAHGTGSRVAGGVGLGLYITRRLARMLDGEVEVQSAVERGSTFTVTLPLAPGSRSPTV